MNTKSNKNIITDFFKDTNSGNKDKLDSYFHNQKPRQRKVKTFPFSAPKNPWWDFLKLLGYDDDKLKDMFEIGFKPTDVNEFLKIWKWSMEYFRNFKINDMISGDDRIWIIWSVEIEIFGFAEKQFVGLDSYSGFILKEGKIIQTTLSARLLHTLVQVCNLINKRNDVAEIQSYLTKLKQMGIAPNG